MVAPMDNPRRCKHAAGNCTVQQCDGWFIVRCIRCNRTWQGEGMVTTLFGEVQRRCPIWVYNVLQAHKTRGGL